MESGKCSSVKALPRWIHHRGDTQTPTAKWSRISLWLQAVSTDTHSHGYTHTTTLWELLTGPLQRLKAVISSPKALPICAGPRFLQLFPLVNAGLMYRDHTHANALQAMQTYGGTVICILLACKKKHIRANGNIYFHSQCTAIPVVKRTRNDCNGEFKEKCWVWVMAASWHTWASTHMHQIQHAYAYSTSQRQITSHLFFFPKPS